MVKPAASAWRAPKATGWVSVPKEQGGGRQGSEQSSQSWSLGSPEEPP